MRISTVHGRQGPNHQSHCPLPFPSSLALCLRGGLPPLDDNDEEVLPRRRHNLTLPAPQPEELEVVLQGEGGREGGRGGTGEKKEKGE
jgi:hypothetical protein